MEWITRPADFNGGINVKNEVRYFLEDVIWPSIKDGSFTPTHLVTAVKLPTGGTEITINTESIPEKIEYILGAYDNKMILKTAQESDLVIRIMNIMVV